MLLGISIRDATAGFRVFRRSALEKVDLGSVESRATSSRPTWSPAASGPG
jgi:hypothetical protein